MDYWFAVSTPANTAEADAIITELKLTTGVITKVWMLHPEGCHALAYASLWRGGHQLYPHNPDYAYNGNDVPMIWEDTYELLAPAILKLKTWNLDETYAHYVFLKITVLRPEELTLIKKQLEILEQIAQRLVGQRLS